MGDPRLQHIAENFDHMKRDLNDTFRFHCTQCGKCCINREDILMSPQDVFKAAQALQMTPHDFVKLYCDCYLGSTSRMPIVRLMPRGSIKRQLTKVMYPISPVTAYIEANIKNNTVRIPISLDKKGIMAKQTDEILYKE